MGDRGYVCAFRGRRDYYQVPIALAESDELDQFITDAYLDPLTRTLLGFLPAKFEEKLRARTAPGIPEDRVTCLWGVSTLEYLGHRLGFAPSRTFAKLDRFFSRAAAARCRKMRSNLLLYSPYAWDAFTSRYSHTPRRILFQYHPHPDLERRILLRDRAEYPFVHDSFAEEAGEHLSDEMRRRGRDCWRHADSIICASAFTKQSLVEAGAPADLCVVVPYGIDLSPEAKAEANPNSFSALFVGNGSQRKGLHHLLIAWQNASLPKDSRLTLVCRYVDQGIEALAHQTADVQIVRGVGRDELKYLYRHASLFVMPSLVEGFGQVYLEALAEGCPVLGTRNTGLPNLGAEADGIFLIEPGNIDDLTATLEALAQKMPGNVHLRQRARCCAMRWSWSRFRDGIRSTLAWPEGVGGARGGTHLS